MMVTWLKFWAAQAASRNERKQRFALIEAAYPLQLPSMYRSAGRRVVRTARAHHPQFLEDRVHG